MKPFTFQQPSPHAKSWFWPRSRICWRRYDASAMPPKNITSKSGGRPARSAWKSRSPTFTVGRATTVPPSLANAAAKRSARPRP
jgi:hypothetical protein